MNEALHPDLIAVAASLRAAGIVPATSGEITDVRAYVDAVNAFTGGTSIPLSDETLLAIRVGEREVPCKLYWPDAAERPPLILYCHGGGFRLGTLAGWDAPLRQLVRESGAAVLSIDYALSPEHRFPTAFDEVVAVMRRTMEAGAVADRDVGRVAAAGDSAGANLILGAGIALRDAGIDALAALTLFYGVYSKDVARRSWERLGGYGLSVASMHGIWSSYLAADEDDWRVEPLHADLNGLPPTRLIVGDLDPLIDENVALSEKLEAAGVPTTLTVLPGINHGVIRFNEVAPVVATMLSTEAAALRRALAG